MYFTKFNNNSAYDPLLSALFTLLIPIPISVHIFIHYYPLSIDYIPIISSHLSTASCDFDFLYSVLFLCVLCFIYSVVLFLSLPVYTTLLRSSLTN